jgi:pimeloyl-ACP methyl ester carboxylesterase
MNATHRKIGRRFETAGTFLLVCFLAVQTAPACARQALPQTKFVNSADGVPIAYEVQGSGAPALIFVHGWSCDRTYWAAQLPVFAKRFKVVAMDLGGHGESGMGRKDWTIASFGSDVATLVQELRLEQVVLIGHSMGGDVVAEAARHLKGRAIGLIWLDTYKELGPGRSPESVDAFGGSLRANFPESTRSLVRSLFIPGSDSALVDRVAADMSSAPPEVALSALYSSFSYSRQITQTLRELKLPVTAINTDTAPTDVESMKREGVEVVIMPGVGHFMMMEDPQRLNRLLSVAIERVRQAHSTSAR